MKNKALIPGIAVTFFSACITDGDSGKTPLERFNGTFEGPCTPPDNYVFLNEQGELIGHAGDIYIYDPESASTFSGTISNSGSISTGIGGIYLYEEEAGGGIINSGVINTNDEGSSEQLYARETLNFNGSNIYSNSVILYSDEDCQSPLIPNGGDTEAETENEFYFDIIDQTELENGSIGYVVELYKDETLEEAYRRNIFTLQDGILYFGELSETDPMDIPTEINYDMPFIKTDSRED